MTVGGNFAVVVTGRFASKESPFDTSLFSRGVNSFTYLALTTKNNYSPQIFSCSRASNTWSDRNFCVTSVLEVVWKRLVWKQLSIKTTSFRCFLQGGRKVVCGTGDGILNLFSWGEWGDISDRFPGHPLSIDSCVAVSDSVVCTGSMDGIIRCVL